MSGSKRPGSRQGDIDKLVGEQLLRSIKNSDLSWEQIAEAADLTVGELAGFISGRKRVGAAKLVALSKVLGISVVTFFLVPPPSE